MAMHPSITIDRLVALIQEGEYIGLCTACGEVQEGIEPDARMYCCDICDCQAVYGAEELLLMLVP